ncbi:MAG: FAD-binding protein, partial [Stenotrophomonas sp.]
FNTKAKQLIVSDAGQVIGVRAQTRDGIKDYVARAVVIAAGGYSANREMLEGAHPGGANILVRGRSWMTGDGLQMAREIGAGVRGVAGVESLHLPVVCVSDKGQGSPTRALPYCVGINQEGQRFVDESLGYASFGKATLKQTRQTVALVFDDTMLKNEKRIGMSVELFQKIGSGLHEAETVAELAQKIQVPAANLEATLKTYNAAVTGDGKALAAVPEKKSLASPIGKD